MFFFSPFGYSNFLVKQAERARTQTHHCFFTLRNVGESAVIGWMFSDKTPCECSLLSDCRLRLIERQQDTHVLNRLLEVCTTQEWLAAGGTPHSESTPVEERRAQPCERRSIRSTRSVRKARPSHMQARWALAQRRVRTLIQHSDNVDHLLGHNRCGRQIRRTNRQMLLSSQAHPTRRHESQQVLQCADGVPAAIVQAIRAGCSSGAYNARKRTS
jgi:hypothetical protein